MPQQNVTTQEDQETRWQEAGLQAAEQLTTSGAGCTTPPGTRSLKHEQAAVTLMNTQPPPTPAQQAARLHQATLQTQPSLQPFFHWHTQALIFDFFFPRLLPFSLLRAPKIFTVCSSLPFASAFSCSAAFVPLFPLHKGIFSRNNCACVTENTQNPYAETVLEAHAT